MSWLSWPQRDSGHRGTRDDGENDADWSVQLRLAIQRLLNRLAQLRQVSVRVQQQ